MAAQAVASAPVTTVVEALEAAALDVATPFLTLATLQDTLSSRHPPSAAVLPARELEVQVMSVLGVRIDCTTSPPRYSRLWSDDPSAAKTASSGLWRSFVVGNNAYRSWHPLSNCINDAEDMGAALASKGHAVTLVLNATKDQLLQAFEAFVSSLSPTCTVVVFFSGHGCAVGGGNFLVPVDGHAGGDGEPSNVHGTGAVSVSLPLALLPMTMARCVCVFAFRDMHLTELHFGGHCSPCYPWDTHSSSGRLPRG
jgi:hypothetical protein